MTYNVSGGAVLGVDKNLTDNTATTLLAATSNTVVLSIVCTEIGGVTPNLSILKTNGTRTVYYRNAKAMTAKETVLYDTPIFLRAGWSLKVTSSNASGLVDVDVTYLDPNKLSA